MEYLPSFGFEPTLIVARIPLIDINQNVTSNNGDVNGTVDVQQFLNPLPLNYATFPFFWLGTNWRLVFLPDPFVTWIPHAFFRALDIIREKNVDLTYISGPPFSPMIIGWLLKRKTGTPLIVDLRDPWTLVQDSRMRYPTKLHERIDTRIERSIFREADAVIAATETISREYAKKYPEFKPKIRVIPNGFDAQDFPEEITPFRAFTVTYAGSLQGSGERPYLLFFDALVNVLNKGLISEEEIQVLLIGAKTRQVDDDIKAKRLETVVKSTRRMPQKQALRCVLASSLLLVIELTSAVTTKVYEYLAAGRPILAIVSPGELEQLVRAHSRTSYVITSCDVREIEDSIVDAYEKWTKNEVPRNDVNQHYLLSQYDRKKLTEDLARVFDLALGQQTDQNSIIHQ